MTTASSMCLKRPVPIALTILRDIKEINFHNFQTSFENVIHQKLATAFMVDSKAFSLKSPLPLYISSFIPDSPIKTCISALEKITEYAYKSSIEHKASKLISSLPYGAEIFESEFISKTLDAIHENKKLMDNFANKHPSGDSFYIKLGQVCAETLLTTIQVGGFKEIAVDEASTARALNLTLEKILVSKFNEDEESELASVSIISEEHRLISDDGLGYDMTPLSGDGGSFAHFG